MKKEWSWLQGGIALGLLSAFAFITYKPLGVSTSYPRTVAILLNSFAPDFVANNAYFQRVTPEVDWQLMLVLGIIAGGFIASRVVRRGQAGDCAVTPVAATAAAAAGPAGDGSAPAGDGGSGAGGASAAPAAGGTGGRISSRRKWMGFLGGFLLLFGARLAGGCTSGHVITGFTQMATASFIFAAAVFAAGIPTAMMLRRKGLV